MLGIVVAVVGMAVTPSQAQAEVGVISGCISWSAANGCEVYQVCLVDSSDGFYACCEYSVSGTSCYSGYAFTPQYIASAAAPAAPSRFDRTRSVRARGSYVSPKRSLGIPPATAADVAVG